MNSSVRSILALSWQALAYGIGVVGSQIIVYLMLPLLTHHMPQEQYGAVSVITAIYAFLNTLTNAGLPSATFRFHSDGKSEREGRLVLGTSQLLFFLFAAVPALGIMILSGPISRLLLGSVQYAQALQLAACFLIADTMNYFGTLILRIQVRPVAASIQGMVLVACETGAALVFVVVYQMGVVGYWLGFVVGEIIGLIFTIWLVRGSIVFQVSGETMLALLKFGIPLIPSALSITALRLADRYIIGSIAGLDQVAIYDVGYKIGSIIGVIISPFRTAWTPFAFSIAGKTEAPKIYRDIMTYLAAGTCFLILSVIAFRTELLHLAAPGSYVGAISTIGWVAASQIFLALYLVVSLGPMIAKRTQDLAWPAVSAGLLNILLNYLLIPAMGIVGAAIATFIAYLALAIMVYLVAQRSFRIPVDWRRLSMILLVGGSVLLIIFAVERLPAAAWVELLAKSVGLLCFPVLLILLRFLTPEQGRAAIAIGRDQLSKRFRAQ